MIVWFTGQPHSGKTTLAQRLLYDGYVDFVIDGDDLRKLMPNPGYDEQGRRQNIDRAQTLAAWGRLAGYHVAVALVSPYRDQREQFKAHVPVHEIYCHYEPLETGYRGREEYWVEDYQPPDPGKCLNLETGQTTVEDAYRSVLKYIDSPALPHRERTV